MYITCPRASHHLRLSTKELISSCCIVLTQWMEVTFECTLMYFLICFQPPDPSSDSWMHQNDLASDCTNGSKSLTCCWGIRGFVELTWSRTILERAHRGYRSPRTAAASAGDFLRSSPGWSCRMQEGQAWGIDRDRKWLEYWDTSRYKCHSSKTCWTCRQCRGWRAFNQSHSHYTIVLRASHICTVKNTSVVDRQW